MKPLSWRRRVWRVFLHHIWHIVGVAVLVVLSGALTIYWDWVRVCWDWFVTGPTGRESGSTTVRNLALVIGGPIAIGVAIWRSIVAQRQADTAQRGLLNERYQKGAEMLGSKVLSVRLGGIYALQCLAEDHPKQYHLQIMRLFCAFVRHPTNDREYNFRSTGIEPKPNIKDYQVSEDVQAAMTAIGTRSDADVELEKKEKFSPDLSGAYLPFVYLFKANLTDADLTHASFYPANLIYQEQAKSIELFQACAYLTEANLSNAFLTGANLTSADLSANLSEAILVGANLTAAYLSKAKGLTQGQLNQARADPDNPPRVDPPLVWCGKPL